MVWSRPILFLLGFLVVLTLILRTFLFELLWVQTDRFAPALQRGDVILGLRTVVPEKGDFVSHLCRSRGSCLSQVIAIEGDRVDLQDGKLWVNQVLQQPLVGMTTEPLRSESDAASQPTERSWVVPPGHYFLYGDERGLLEPQSRVSVFSRVLFSMHFSRVGSKIH